MKQATDLSKSEAIGYKSRYVSVPNRRPSNERGSTEVSRPNVRPSEERRGTKATKLNVESTEASRPNARMKILYLITKGTYGGAQRYVYDLATSLPKSEFEPVVACGTLGKLANDLIHAGIKGKHLPSLVRDIGIFSDIKSFFEIRAAIREFRPEVIHLNSSKAAALGVFAARLEKVPCIVFTVHGWPFKENRNLFVKIFVFLASWITALLSHHVIVVSKKDASLAHRMLGLRRKTEFVELGIPSLKTLPPAEAFRAMFATHTPPSIGPSTLRVATIAELTLNKGISYAIDAVAELSKQNVDIIYVVAGEGEERARLEMRARKEGVGDRVFFLGFVANAAQNLPGFDVLVLPSIKEGTPYVLLEAARTGIPCVATSVIDTSLAERISNLHIVPPADTSALTEAIREAAKKPRLEQGRESLFPLDAMVARHIDIYTR